MREKFARFMAGRYGNDQLNMVISKITLILLIASLLLTHFVPFIGQLCWLVCIANIIITYFRMFSKDIATRTAENQKYLNWKYKKAVDKKYKKDREEQSKDYKFFKCPKCGVLNRVPKGKGKIEITCPKCGEHFIRKS